MTMPEKLGQLLKVDLTSGICSMEELPREGIKYLGGRGFNVWYLLNRLSRHTDPLSPKNILMISCGLLTGSSAPASARVHINALSPLTGILGSSNIGGYIGPWLRSCGIAAIAVSGASPDKTYLHINAHGARLAEASGLWGCDAFETQDRLKQIHKGARVLAIGQGGENRVRFAAIMTEKDHAAGRTGMGAVMGAKLLKAVVVEKGGHKHFRADTPGRKTAVRDYAARIKSASEFDFFSRYGGAGYIDWVNNFGIMGSKNYRAVGVDHIEKIDGRQLEKNLVKKTGCARCPVQCKADLQLGPGNEIWTRPEFEPIVNLGPKCGLDDLNRIVRLDNLCSRLGLDCTSTASVIAFAMDLFEQGKLSDELAGNLDLTWGNADAMETLIFQMVENRGLGKLLRLGVRAAARQIGNRADDHAAHVKGLELTAYHPSAIMGTALGYAVSSRGGDYNNVYASLEYAWSEEEAVREFGTREAVDIKSLSAKGYLIKKAVTTNIIVDCLGLCKVPVLSLLKSFNLEGEAELVRSLTGLDLTHGDLADLGCEIATMERQFNLAHAEEGSKDDLPSMFVGDGDRKIQQQDFSAMRAEFYRAMGWDESGMPDASVP